jgi:hypothetical protein
MFRKRSFSGHTYETECGDADEGEQVPPKPHPPQHEPAPATARTGAASGLLPPFGRARHDERRQERTHEDS